MNRSRADQTSTPVVLADASARGRYVEALAQYCANPSEAELYHASLISQALVEDELGPDEVVAVHFEALAAVLTAYPYRRHAEVISDAGQFLLETMIAYGVHYKTYLDYRARERSRQLEEGNQVAELLGRLELAQAAARIGTFEWRADTDRVAWTTELEALYGLAPGSFDGTLATWYRLVQAEDRDHFQRTLRDAVEREAVYTARFRIARLDGVTRVLEARGRVLRGEAGRVAGIVGVNVDVTERERAFEEAQEARLAAEHAARARDEFLSIASHELRTPIAGMKAVAQTLLKAQAAGRLDDKRLRASLERLNVVADRAAALVADLLDASRLQGGPLQLRLESLDLPALLERLVERFRTEAPCHSFALTAPRPKREVRGDPERIEQMLAYLIDNAIKYSPGGGEIRIRLLGQRHGVVIEVEDRGIGLPPGSEAFLFRPFGRAPNAVARHVEGLGLGLYLARSIVDAHGGWIRMDSAGEDQGTLASVCLPDESLTTREGADA